MAEPIRADQVLEFPERLPVVALRDLVFFPYMVLPLLIGRPRSLAALAGAEAETGGLLLLLAQRDSRVVDPETEDLYDVGTVVRVVQVDSLQDGTVRAVFEGIGRARAVRFVPTTGSFAAMVEPFTKRESDPPDGVGTKVEALARRVVTLYEDYARLNERVPRDVAATLAETRDRHRLLHLMGGHLLAPSADKQPLLEAQDLSEGLQLVQQLLTRELEILRIEEKLDEQIQQQLDVDRRQLYLNEQLKAIHRELGTEAGDEWVELDRTLAEVDLPEPARERAERELSRLRRLNPVAPEAAVIRTYLDWILALPWRRRTEDNLDVGHAEVVLDEAHYGLAEVKERVLDHIAVLSLVGRLQGPILCLVGPPGVGKTSLGRSIADALGREFVRVSLGGVRDEAEIRGHRRTYVGAMPGRILQGMRRGGPRTRCFCSTRWTSSLATSTETPGRRCWRSSTPSRTEASPTTTSNSSSIFPRSCSWPRRTRFRAYPSRSETERR